jgi:hypothetical protein
MTNHDILLELLERLEIALQENTPDAWLTVEKQATDLGFVNIAELADDKQKEL